MIGRFLVSTVISVAVAYMAGAVEARVAAAGHGGAETGAHKEPRPYDKSAEAWSDVDAAFSRARRSGKRVILAMGANWCHDSRSLAAKFQTPVFETLISKHYELVYIDVGQKNRNKDIARFYGIDDIVGTPTVLILSEDQELLNKSTAPTWRNAASRSLDDTLLYFTAYAGGAVIEGKP